MQESSRKIWLCRDCASRLKARVELPWPGSSCSCGAQPSYLDVLAALKHGAESQAKDAVALAKGTREGQWWPCRDEQGGRSAMLRCPQCGRPAFLYDYEIDAEGLVEPAFACEGAECSYDETIRLDGWPTSSR